jgi:hypothetical protein
MDTRYDDDCIRVLVTVQNGAGLGRLRPSLAVPSSHSDSSGPSLLIEKIFNALTAKAETLPRGHGQFPKSLGARSGGEAIG